MVQQRWQLVKLPSSLWTEGEFGRGEGFDEEIVAGGDKEGGAWDIEDDLELPPDLVSDIRKGREGGPGIKQVKQCVCSQSAHMLLSFAGKGKSCFFKKWGVYQHCSCCICMHHESLLSRSWIFESLILCFETTLSKGKSTSQYILHCGAFRFIHLGVSIPHTYLMF